MVAWGVGLLLLMGGGLLLHQLGRLAQRRGQPPGTWIMGVMTAWALCWVIEKYGLRLWLAQEVSAGPHMRLYLYVVGGTLLACMLAYGVAFLILWRKPPPESSWDEKLSRIGQGE